MNEANPKGSCGDEKGASQEQADAEDKDLEDYTLEGKGFSGDHFFPSLSFWLRKSTWCLTFLSKLILCSMTSEA